MSSMGRPATYASGEKSARKYRALYAEPESALCDELRSLAIPFGHGLAIPSYGEGDGVAPGLESLRPGPRGEALIVIVVNAPANASMESRAANAQTAARIRADYGEGQPLGGSARLHPHPSGKILVIDRSTENPLPPGQGVGLARKIGADLLHALVDEGLIESPWIHCSDADAVFPEDYFEQCEEPSQEGEAALLYRFRHVAGTDSAAHEAALRYEISLRYYVLGLRFAKSPYAFHSIGSTLAIHANAYARVRGFPRREAAEDFYLLNKLAKVGSIRPLTGRPLELSSRTSFRVPFGTGAAIRRLLEKPPAELETYSPGVFYALGAWQSALELATQQPGTGDALRKAVVERAELDQRVDAALLLRTLEARGDLQTAERALAGGGSGLRRRVLENFDGFRALKLIHALRDAGLENIPLDAALEEASFVSPLSANLSPGLETLADHLEAQEFSAGASRAG